MQHAEDSVIPAVFVTDASDVFVKRESLLRTASKRLDVTTIAYACPLSSPWVWWWKCSTMTWVRGF